MRPGRHLGGTSEIHDGSQAQSVNRGPAGDLQVGEVARSKESAGAHGPPVGSGQPSEVPKVGCHHEDSGIRGVAHPGTLGGWAHQVVLLLRAVTHWP